VKKNIVSLSTLALALFCIASASNGASLTINRPAPIVAPSMDPAPSCPPPLVVCAFESGSATQ
jgi:hypothetical protein